MSLALAVSELHPKVLDLVVDEEHLPLKSVDAVRALGRDAVPTLISIVESGLIGDSWAPIHAVRLLSELEAPELIPLAVRVLPLFTPGDLLIGALLEGLTRLGRVATSGLLSAAEATGDPETRSTMLTALAVLAVPDDQVLHALVEATRQRPELYARALAHYGDARALEVLLSLARSLPEPDGDDPIRGFALTEVAGAIQRLGGTVPAELTGKLGRLRVLARKARRFVHARSFHEDESRSPGDPGPTVRLTARDRRRERDKRSRPKASRLRDG